jgi:hypothetical protein
MIYWENGKKFKKEFYRVHNNILEANLMKDMGLAIDERTIAEVVFCDEKRQELEDRLDNVKVKECVDFPGRGCKSKTEVEACLRGGKITWAEYFRIRQEVVRVLLDFSWDGDSNSVSMKISEFMDRNTKGSKRFREILTGRWSMKYEQSDPCMINSGRTLWGENHNQMGRSLVQ